LKPLTKKYLKFFLIAYLLFRLPSFVIPLTSDFLLNKAVNSLKNAGVHININSKEVTGLGSFKAEKIVIRSERGLFPEIIVDSIKTELVSFFPPKIEIVSSSYEGELNCTFISKSISELIFKNFGNAQCIGKNFNLVSFPIIKTKNVLGRLSFELNSDISKDIWSNESKISYDISNGYFEIDKILATSLIKIPPFSKIDSTGTIILKSNLITLENIQFRSNYGFLTSEGVLKSNPSFKFLDMIEVKGSFNLSNEGFEALAPWTILINNGKQLSNKKGTFTANGKPPNIKFSLNEN
jgi:hypothetical protein